MNKKICGLLISFIILLNCTLLFADQINTIEVKGSLLTDTLRVDTILSNSPNKKIFVLDTLLLVGLKSAKAGDSIVTIDPITGQLRRRNAASTGGTNIYNNDGTLTGNRTVTMLSNNINFTGGRIGIGNAYPLGPLHLDDGAANRKIILYQTVNNDHEFYGFGIGANILRYQIGSLSGSHVFYSGLGDHNSKELLRIQGTGNVGIGNSDPLGPLHFANTGGNRKLILYQTVNNENEFFGFGIGIGTLRYHIASSSASHVFYSGIDATSSKELMRIQGDGKILIPSLIGTNTTASANVTDSVVMVNPATGELRRRDASKLGGNIYGVDGTLIANRTVNMAGKNLNFTGGKIGIGNANPFGPLHFENTVVNRKLILYQTVNNEHDFYGFGVNSSVLRYQVGGSTGSHVFYGGINATSSKELMRIQGDGKILISSLASANVTDSIVMVDPATGELRRKDASKIGRSIYITDGTLTGNRTVNMAGKNLNFTGGRIGIGNANPWGQLHFGNVIANRKIILYQVDNNEYDFYGFGVNSGVLRYQVGNSTGFHVFYSSIDANSSKELMRIQGDGKILIPSLTSTNSSASASATDSIVTVDPATGELRRRDVLKVSVNSYITDGTLMANRTVTMVGRNLNFTGGNIGINNPNPWGQLHFDNVIANRKIILYQTINNDHQFTGFGVNNGELRYQVASLTGAHIFYGGANATSSKELLRIHGNGNVCINCTGAPQVPLEVLTSHSGQLWFQSRVYFDASSSIQIKPPIPGGFRDLIRLHMSIFARGAIVSGASIAATSQATFSDRRIKKDISLSDSKLDLNILNKIRVSNYKLIDFRGQGNGTHKKVIAQELEQVYPQATLTSTSHIPNVYQMSDSIIYLSDTLALVSFSKPLDSECVVGRRIRFHNEAGKELSGIITEVKEKSLVISQVPKNQKGIFVYGVEVTDFKSVDYDEVAMLNVSATQEVYKTVITQENTIQELETTIQVLETTIQELETTTQEQEKQLEEALKLMESKLAK